MKFIRQLFALLFGLILFFSGLFKLMDPVGAGLIVDEYFRFFGVSWLHFAAKGFGVLLALFETVLGVALVTGVWRRIVAIVSVAMMGFYTLITLILVIFNPSMDCGCFGEVIHLSHMQSLVKNLVLLVFWAIAFLPFRSHEPSRKIKYVSFSIASISVVLFSLYSMFSLPLMDFTAYGPGSELASLDDLELEDDGNAAVLSFSDVSGEYRDSLAMVGPVMACSVYDVQKVSDQRWESISRFTSRAARHGFTPLVLVASTADAMESSSCPQELLSYVYFADRKEILTLNRSNGGASYFHDGQIVSKWSVWRLPDDEKLSELAACDPIESLAAEKNASSLKLQAFMLYVLAVILLL